jgi:hypothetical protein
MTKYDLIGVRGRVRVLLLDQRGQVVEERWTKNFLTELGEAYIADRLSDRNHADGDIDNMAIGTGSGQSRTSTTLATEVARVSGGNFTVSQGTAGDDNDVIWQGTFGTSVPASNQTISETALFSLSSAGVMINYAEIQPAIFKPTTLTLVVQIFWTIGAS